MEIEDKYPHLKAVSEESRAKAVATRERKVSESQNWKHDWLGEPLWAHLRRMVGLRAIPSFIHCSEVKYIRRTLKAVNKDSEWWRDNFFPAYKDFGEYNPTTPAYVLQGIILELAMPEEVLKWRVEDEDKD